MTYHPHPEDTLVTLPAISLAGMRAIVRQAVAAQPDAAPRIRRGLAILLEQPLCETGEIGTYQVTSCRDATVTYYATSSRCTCPDAARHPDARCKHSWAILLLVAASVEARWEAVTAPRPPDDAPDPDDHDPRPMGRGTRYELTPRGRAALVAQRPDGLLTRRLAEYQRRVLADDWARRTEVA